MKYAIVILGGAGDEPSELLAGRTALQAATTPALDRVARLGRVGRVATAPEAVPVGSDVCLMGLLGYDPRERHTGRAPLEAAGRGVQLADVDWAFRINFCTVGLPGEAGAPERHDPGAPDSAMLDYSAGHLASHESARLIDDLLEHWRETAPDLAQGLGVAHGLDYRALLIDGSGRDHGALRTHPAHEIMGDPWRRRIPAGSGADSVVRLMDLSIDFLAQHPINRVRRAEGKRPANLAWIWGQGRRPELPSFTERYGLRAACLAGVDVMRGLATLAGVELLDTPGTASTDNIAELRAWGDAACAALADNDLVIVYATCADECSHSGDMDGKVRAIERLDEHVVGPILAQLESLGEPDADASMAADTAEGWRLLAVCDHVTATERQANTEEPPPFAMAGSWVRRVVELPFSEAGAAESDLLVDPGHDLMEYFLYSGLKAPRKGAPIRPPVARRPARG